MPSNTCNTEPAFRLPNPHDIVCLNHACLNSLSSLATIRYGIGHGRRTAPNCAQPFVLLDRTSATTVLITRQPSRVLGSACWCTQFPSRLFQLQQNLRPAPVHRHRMSSSSWRLQRAAQACSTRQRLSVATLPRQPSRSLHVTRNPGLLLGLLYPAREFHAPRVCTATTTTAAAAGVAASGRHDEDLQDQERASSGAAASTSVRPAAAAQAAAAHLLNLRLPGNGSGKGALSQPPPRPTLPPQGQQAPRTAAAADSALVRPASAPRTPAAQGAPAGAAHRPASAVQPPSSSISSAAAGSSMLAAAPVRTAAQQLQSSQRQRQGGKERVSPTERLRRLREEVLKLLPGADETAAAGRSEPVLVSGQSPPVALRSFRQLVSDRAVSPTLMKNAAAAMPLAHPTAVQQHAVPAVMSGARRRTHTCRRRGGRQCSTLYMRPGGGGAAARRA